MVHIPEELRNDKFRFLRIADNDKKAIDKGWNDTANYTYNDPALLKHLENGGNYGIVCGIGGLVVWDIDIDDEKLLDDLKAKLGEHNTPTFAVKTGKSKGLHFYYICDNLAEYNGKAVINLELDGVHVGEIRIRNCYVIGPGSVHPNGKTYNVVGGGPISTVSIKYILNYLNTIVKTTNTGEVGNLTPKEHNLLADIRIEDIAMPKKAERSGDEWRGTHPIHGSANGSNFHINTASNEWFCHRCKSGGDVALWLAVEAGIIQCEEAQKGALASKKYYNVLEYAKEKGLISKIPPIEVTGNKPLVRLNEIAHEEKYKDGKHKKWVFSPYDAATIMIDRFNIINRNGVLWRYNEGVYTPDADTFIFNTLEPVAKNMYRPAVHEDVVGRIRYRVYSAESITDKNPYLFGVENGVIDLKTGTFREYNLKDFITLKSPIKYDPRATCPNIDKFLRDVVEDSDDVKVIIDMFITGAISKALRRFYVLIGQGHNGKGHLQQLLRAFFGKDQLTAVQLATLSRGGFAWYEIFMKRIISNGELQISAMESDNIKRITGGDPVHADRKYQNPIDFSPFAVPVFDTNNPPKFSDNSVGFRGRMITITFPYEFVAKPDGTDPYQKLKDVDLIDKITTPEELSGLLNKIVQRAPEMVREGEPFRKLSVDETAEMYSEQSHSMISFFENCTEFEAYEIVCDHMTDREYRKATNSGFMATKHLYKFYREYCNKYLIVGEDSMRRFGSFMRKQGEGLGLPQSRGMSTDPETGKRENLRGCFGVFFRMDKFKELVPDTELSTFEDQIFPQVENWKATGKA